MNTTIPAAISIHQECKCLTPGFWGRSSLLIRAADPPPRISHRFPPGDVPLQPGARTSCKCRPPFPPTIPATCLIHFGAPAHPVARFATGETHYRSPIPADRTRSRPRGHNLRHRKQALQQGFHSRNPSLGRQCRHRSRHS